MKKLFCFILMIGYWSISDAQSIFTIARFGGASGLWDPSRSSFNRHVEGSPFLLRKFSNATIYLDQNKVITEISANIDLQNNEVLVLDEKKKLFAISVPVYRIVFDDESTGLERTVLSGLPPIDKLTEKSYYELLSPGKFNLLKSIKLYWSDSRAYHEAATTRKYEQEVTYYIYNDDRGIIKLPKIAENIPTAIDAQQAGKLSKIIAEHKLNLKQEADLIKLLNLYNNQ